MSDPEPSTRAAESGGERRTGPSEGNADRTGAQRGSEGRRRYVIVGLRNHAEQWARDHGVPMRDRIIASSHLSLRGVVGDLIVVWHESITRMSPKALDAISTDLRIAAATGGAVTDYDPRKEGA